MSKSAENGDDITIKAGNNPPIKTSGKKLKKLADNIAEVAKDSLVDGELTERQMPMFDGFKVERIEANIKAGEVHLIEDMPHPKYNDRRYFLVKGRVSEVKHKKQKIGSGLMAVERFSRIASFDVLSANEITELEAQKLITKK